MAMQLQRGSSQTPICAARLSAPMRNAEAWEVFESIPHPDEVSWTALLLGCTENGQEDLALELFTRMKDEGCAANSRTLVAVLKACSDLAAKEQGRNVGGKLVKLTALGKGMEIHSEARKFECDVFDRFVDTKLVELYAKCGSMVDAREVFDKMQHHDVVSWTTLIQGYVENGEEELGLELFSYLLPKGVMNSRSFIAALNGCTNSAAKEEGRRIDGKLVKVGALEQGMIIHSYAEEKTGYDCSSDLFLASTLLSMYGKCGSLVDARGVFDRMVCYDDVSCTAMIQVYAENGEEDLALQLFRCLLPFVNCRAGVFIAALNACTNLAGREEGRRIEDNGSDLEQDSRVACTMVNMFSKCGSLVEACRVFNKLLNRDVISWNSLLLGYVDNQEPELAEDHFAKMKASSSFNSRTFAAIVKAYGLLARKEEGLVIDGKLVSLEKGRAIHLEAVKLGWDSEDLFLASSLVDMYIKCGSLEDAQRVFDRIRKPCVVSWNTLIAGYVETGEEDLALNLVARKGFQPNARTFVAALTACTALAMKEEGRKVDGRLLKAEALEKGRKIHSEAAETGHDSDNYVGSSLVNFYARCGALVEAEAAFQRIVRRDVIAWNVLLLCYADNEKWEKCLDCFSRMDCEADAGTFAAVLKACGALLHLEFGRFLHAKICEFGDDGDAVLRTCLLDFYAKCGRMLEAQLVFDSIASMEANTVTWSALISGYSHKGDVDAVFEHFQRMKDEDRQPNAVTFVALLTACSHAGLVEKGRKYFGSMRQEFGISPGIEHYHCLVDLLGRANELNDAFKTIKEMPFEADVVTWKTLLAACLKWKNVGLGRQAFESVLKLDEGDVAAYVLMANLCSQSPKN